MITTITLSNNRTLCYDADLYVRLPNIEPVRKGDLEVYKDGTCVPAQAYNGIGRVPDPGIIVLRPKYWQPKWNWQYTWDLSVDTLIALAAGVFIWAAIVLLFCAE